MGISKWPMSSDLKLTIISSLIEDSVREEKYLNIKMVNSFQHAKQDQQTLAAEENKYLLSFKRN